MKNKKIIIAPDSFKGSLSSSEACDIIKNACNVVIPEAETVCIPIADGGEGTVDAYLAVCGGNKVFTNALSPLGRRIKVYYALLPNNTAVIETAQASGITIENLNNALAASTFGTGQLIKHALEGGAKRILLGLGGSATTDGGAGLISALGGRFLNADGDEIEPGGKGLNELSSIDLSGLDSRLKNVELTVLCDVKNPLYGSTGAAYVYAPQKGANDDDVELLDNALKRLANVSAKVLGTDFSSSEGAGAAGGLGFACVAFLGGKLKSGIDALLNAADFENLAADASLIITGEGKMDNQSLMGKAPFGVASRSGSTPVAAIVGVNEADINDAKKLGIISIFETNPKHLPFERVLPTATEDLFAAAVEMLKTIVKQNII